MWVRTWRMLLLGAAWARRWQWAAAEVNLKGAANVVLVPVLLELVRAAAVLDFKGAEFVDRVLTLFLLMFVAEVVRNGGGIHK